MSRFLASLVAAALLVGPAVAMAQNAPQSASSAPAAAPSAAAATPAIAPAGDIVDTLKAAGQFDILLKALDAANLTGVLKSAGPLTLLAPTDDAFKALPPGQLDDLLKADNATQLQQLLVYHLINAAVAPAKIDGSVGPIRTVAGPDVQINATAAPIKINDATVIGVGTVSNGFVYAIDKVLTPPPAAPAK